MNSIRLSQFAKKNNKIIVKWKKKLSLSNLPLSVQNALYDIYPELIGEFVSGAPSVITSNNSGNVDLKIVNGSKCIMESLCWKDRSIQIEIEKKISRSIRSNNSEVFIDVPPDFILVTLLDKDGNPRKREDFPINIDLVLNENDSNVVIPISCSISEKIEISNKQKLPIQYQQHAVDLGFSFTVWKVQGLTFDKIIIHLDPVEGCKDWTFENIYVAFSRVRKNAGIRCLKLDARFNPVKLIKKIPNI